ncbi:MAG: hypothetical protein K2H38_10950 [Muribaculaceae bacterium]|nr:hypothetical protein [Muribaculaceae bacterium]
MNDRRKKITGVLPLLLILLIGIAYALMGFWIPPVGDDLGFIDSFQSQNDCWYAFPRYMYRAWLWNNARMADMLNPIGYIFMPQWLKAVSNGVVVMLMFYMTLRLASQLNQKSPFIPVLLISILTFAMRWDGIWMEYNTFYNYVWSSTFAMLALCFLFSRYSSSDKWYCWLMLPFCFIASAMHEAIGLPMAASLVIMLIITPFYRNAAALRRLVLIAMISGGLFTLTSPGNFKRIGSMLQPEPSIQIIFGSAAFVVILLLLSAYLFVYRKSLFYTLLRSPWIVYVGIALFSSAFMLMSGFGGRTGWFAQLFAVIAVFQVITKSGFTVGKNFGWICSVILSCMIIFHMVMLAVWQRKLSEETREVIAEYRNSTDGIVFFDYTKDSQLPWYLLRKNHGVPDDDDSYYRYRMRRHYGEGRQLVILPTSFNPIPDTLTTPVSDGDFILTSRMPENVSGDTIVAIFPRIITLIEDKEYIINEFSYQGRQLYLLSLIDRDRGEK